jgi:hypothetical protein
MIFLLMRAANSRLPGSATRFIFLFLFTVVSSGLQGQNIKDIYEPVFVGRPNNNSFNGLVQLPDGELRHYGFEGSWFDSSQHTYFYIYSKDHGLTWEKRITGNPDHFTSENSPPAARSPHSGDFIRVISTGEGTFVMRSTQGIDGSYRKSLIDPLPISMIRQPYFLGSTGRILVTGNGRSPEYQGTTVLQSVVMYSDDDGFTWKKSYVPAGPRFRVKWPHKKSRWQNYAIEPAIAELGDGSIWMLMRTSQDQLYESFSADQGSTWSEPLPSRFYSTLTMPAFLRLKDGRLLLFFNSTTPLPEEDRTGDTTIHEEQKTGETWEDVFTNRDVLHATISDDDGKTWRGFREIYLNPLRNEPDFATIGGTQVSLDKSVHQCQAKELPHGKVLLALGQHPTVRAMIIFDPEWLYETGRSDNFSDGLDSWTTFKYMDGIKGHCAYDRHPGPQLVDHPDIGGRKVLPVRHLPDNELVCSVDGAVWNFPASAKGSFTTRIMLKPGGKGGRLSLMDRWFNPTDTLAYRYAMYTIKFNGEGKIENEPLQRPGDRVFPVSGPSGSDALLQPGEWVDVRFEWDDLTYGNCRVDVNGRTYLLPLRYQSRNGINYIHFQSVANEADESGFIIESVKAEGVDD